MTVERKGRVFMDSPPDRGLNEDEDGKYRKHGAAEMTPPKGEEKREKAPLPLEAEPEVLHFRLQSVEKTNRVILKRLTRLGEDIRKDVADGFRKCAETRPCSKTQGTQGSAGVDWSAWSPVIQKVLIGAAIIGTMIAGAVGGVAKIPQPMPAAISGGGK